MTSEQQSPSPDDSKPRNDSKPPDVSKPRGNWDGFKRYFKQDFVSGLLVFLIALPLCLGISLASGYPPLAGVFTAIIGSFVTTFISNSELTIKGPAAGLIVIAIGCVEDFGGNGMIGGFDAADMTAYQAALAVGVAAAVLQILFGVFRAGVLGEFFPLSAVHGMLAAIGIIIIIKQVPVALGVEASGAPLKMLSLFPQYFANMNPQIAAIGLVSLLIMFVWPWLRTKMGPLSVLPGPLIVLLVAVPMGMAFDLMGRPQYLVQMPDRMFGMFDEITTPDFAALAMPKAWKWVFMFFVIGSLESLLSAKAVDLLDPHKRKSDMNRDVIAVGAGNLCCSMIGGLPMISEIVRSRANIDNGAKTRFADLWHGVFLLVCVALIPTVLHRIPLAALAAMLVYTGFRLAHPMEFLHVYRIGREQLAIFVTTIVAVLATDLLIGIAIGIALKMAIHLFNGVAMKSLFVPEIRVEDVGVDTVKITTLKSAVFSNWISLSRQIDQASLLKGRNLILDFSEAHLVDHSTIEKLSELDQDFKDAGLRLEIVGLESMKPFSADPHAARIRMGAQ